MDPCLYKLYDGGKPTTMIVIEVDDLLACGKGFHLKKMDELRSIYQFGKWVNLKEEAQGTAFNGGRIQREESGGLLIDMTKFIEGRLDEIQFQDGGVKGRRERQKKKENKPERHAARSTGCQRKEGQTLLDLQA